MVSENLKRLDTTSQFMYISAVQRMLGNFFQKTITLYVISGILSRVYCTHLLCPGLLKILFMFMEQKLSATPNIMFPKLCNILKTRVRGGLNLASKKLFFFQSNEGGISYKNIIIKDHLQSVGREIGRVTINIQLTPIFTYYMDFKAIITLHIEGKM